MKTIRSWGASLAAALLLAACGGSDPDVPGSGGPSGAPTTPGSFQQVVSFGDSLSDAGTYGARFTINGLPTSRVWVENVAAALNPAIPLTIAQRGGFGVAPVNCPAATTTCTAYAQGGARVTLGRAPNFQLALTLPVADQITNHLAQFVGFDDNDLIFVFAGANDVIDEFTAFSAAASAAAANPQLTADQRALLQFQAQTEAQAALKQAALELAANVRDRILARGGKYVAVLTLPDISAAPFGQAVALQAQAQGAGPQTVAQLLFALRDMSAVFNLWLREGLTGAPVQLIDTEALFQAVRQNPGNFGMTNVTTPACTGLALSTSGPCTPLTLVAGADATTWLFADPLHPTPGGHRLISDSVMAQLRSFGWIN